MNYCETNAGRELCSIQYLSDCAVRATTIVMHRPYSEVLLDFLQFPVIERALGMKKGFSTLLGGISFRTLDRYLKSKNFSWTPKRCGFSLTTKLPKGRLIVDLPAHVTAVVDGIVYDNEAWCKTIQVESIMMYGYWRYNGVI